MPISKSEFLPKVSTEPFHDEEALEILREHRRTLHKIPEIGSRLYKTNAYISAVLSTLPCTVIPVAGTGICAFFDMGQETTTAFRCDMDALPEREANKCDYVSTHLGAMHACGHDGHMSMVITLAQYLSTLESLPCNVLLIFQPAEETSGGAKKICKTGILEHYNVTKIFGIHLWPFVAAGRLTAKSGTQMARSAMLTIDVTGKSAHAATAEKGIDALAIACEYIGDIYARHEAEIPTEERTVLKICKFKSGTTRNIISDKATFVGTIRAFNTEIFDYMLKLLREVADEYELKCGCRFDIHCTEGYPPIVNDAELYEAIQPALMDLDFEELKKPLMIAEDFSFYGLEVPSVYFLLGTGTGIPLHSVNFDFDERILLSGYQLYKNLLYI